MFTEKSNVIPLRLFMGVQMLVYGILCAIDPKDLRGAYLYDQYGWIWIVLLVTGGLWLAVLAAMEIYAGWYWRGLGKKSCRRCLKVSRILTVPGYFYAGAVWAGLGYKLVVDGHFQTVDFMAPVYLLFLLFVAYKDACAKRSKVLRNETT